MQFFITAPGAPAAPLAAAAPERVQGRGGLRGVCGAVGGAEGAAGAVGGAPALRHRPLLRRLRQDLLLRQGFRLLRRARRILIRGEK